MSISPPPQDHYKVLGVPKAADSATIRSVYRKLVLSTHPDKFLDEAIKAKKVEEFHQVQKAYETLSDDKQRERYDAICRLAELKAERFKVEGSLRKQESPYSPRPTPETSWRSSPIFEEIRPKQNFYDEPRPAEPRSSESRPSPHHQEYRARHRDYDDYDDFIPANGTSRKATATTTSRPTESRQDDASSRVRNRWKTASSKLTEKAKEKEYEDRRKSRDKGRRDDGQSKRTHVRIPADGDSASDMDPEIEAFMGPGTPYRKSERPRSYEDDTQKSRRKYEPRAISPDRESRMHHNFQSAAQYIAKSIGKPTVDRDSRRRPSLSRAPSSNRTQVAPPPPPPPMPPVDDATRSSARRGGFSRPSKSSSKRGPPEIVEPRKRDADNESRRPSLTSSLTSPSTLKPLRSATMEAHSSERPKTSFRRVATSPLATTSANMTPHKPSKLRETHDSGYSSPGTPETSTPRTTRTSYRVQMESDSDSEAAPGGRPHFVLIDPDKRRPNGPDPSARSTSYRGDRGGGGGSSGSTRHGPSRSHTLEEFSSQSHRPPPLNRAATERPNMLFGEVSRGSPEPRESRAQYSDVRQSPRYEKSDVNYTPYPRRSSPNEKDSRAENGDAYGAYERRGSLPHRPGRAQEV